jgi:hypothetical protein
MRLRRVWQFAGTVDIVARSRTPEGRLWMTAWILDPLAVRESRRTSDPGRIEAAQDHGAS